jgi:hypothetical protein
MAPVLMWFRAQDYYANAPDIGLKGTVEYKQARPPVNPSASHRRFHGLHANQVHRTYT